GPVAQEAARRALEAIDDGARRTGMSRRRFLQLCGTATVLGALAACSREEAASPATTSTSSTTSSTTTPGGTFVVPDEAAIEPEAAEEALGGEQFVVDVQTHLLEFDLGTPAGGFFGGGFPQASCGLDDPRSCFSIDQWIALVLEQSDTAVAVLSAVPIVDDPSPLSTEVMERARREAAAIGCDGRVLLQGEAFPTTGETEAVLDGMSALAADHDIVAWKTYTHVGTGWFLDDHDPEAAQVGQRFLDRVRELGAPMVAVHKGFGNDRFASPVDIGPAAAANPDLSFLVYHSGYQPGVVEGPYDPAAPNAGIDRLIASVDSAGIGADGNVFAELGSTWFNLLRDPTQAAHALGKLLVTFGPERILWGTDSIWYGSPQAQIEAFRTFEISAELQERHGYPELTDEAKTMILGGNAARLHGIETPECGPKLDPTESAAPTGALGPATEAEARAVFAAHHPWWSTTPV
ncbi:MAG: amidohydrolase family protein, partial [Actinomycetota bacterium]